MLEYVVVRTWQTRHKKQRRQIAVGPYPTRYSAQKQINKYIDEYGYWDDRDQFSIALYRRPAFVAELRLVE